MLKKRRGCHRKLRHSANTTSNIEISFTTSVNTEMKNLFVVVTIACLGPILVCISAQTPSPSPNASVEGQSNADENTDHTEQCDCPSSPDGKFAFVLSFGEKDAFEDRLQILDLIEKESGKKMQRIDDAEMPVSWNVLWAPDSNGFALKTKVEGHPRLEGSDAYFRNGETFRKVELPKNDAYYSNVVWAPNLKRFAFNLYYRLTNRTTVAFYQLRNDKWVTLQSPVDEASKHTQLAQLAKKYSPKNTYRKGDSSAESDSLEARRWTDANTVILFAHSEHDEGEAAALFTLKFDEAGNWKIVKMHRLSAKELEEERVHH